MILRVLRVVLRRTTEYCEVRLLVLRDTTRYKEVPFVTLRGIISSLFWWRLANASKLAVVQYHRKTPTVESFLIKLSAWGCNFNNRRTLSSCFSENFIKILITVFWKTLFGRIPLKNHTLYLRPLVIPHSDLHYNSYYLVVPPSTTRSTSWWLVVPRSIS